MIQSVKKWAELDKGAWYLPYKSQIKNSLFRLQLLVFEQNCVCWLGIHILRSAANMGGFGQIDMVPPIQIIHKIVKIARKRVNCFLKRTKTAKDFCPKFHILRKNFSI